MNIEWDKNRRSFESIIEAIGMTPLVNLTNVTKSAGLQTSISGKCEFVNPSGSLKDRVYYRMITEAIRKGTLKQGMEIIEVSTGNAGIACTWLGTMFGFEVTIILPEGMSEERKKIIKALGGNIIETPGAESDVDLSYDLARKMISENPLKYWFVDQYTNEDAVMAHYATTGKEIWEQTSGKVDAFVITQGTGGTITGVGRYLKEKKPSVRIFAAEPSEAPLLSKRRWGTHKIEGIGDGFVPRNLSLELLDGIVTVSSAEAIKWTKELITKEKILAGISSGANLMAAIKVFKKHPELKNIVIMLNDSAMRYYTTELFGSFKKVKIPEREHPLDDYTVTELNKYHKNWEIID